MIRKINLVSILLILITCVGCVVAQVNDKFQAKEYRTVPTLKVPEVMSASIGTAVPGNRTLVYWIVSIDANGNKSKPSGAFVSKNSPAAFFDGSGLNEGDYYFSSTTHILYQKTGGRMVEFTSAPYSYGTVYPACVVGNGFVKTDTNKLYVCTKSAPITWSEMGSVTTSSASARYYNTITWVPVTGAVAYDILRTTSTVTPSGDCNCAIATNVTKNFQIDNTESTISYTVSDNGNDFVESNEIVNGIQSKVTRYNGNVVALTSKSGGLNKGSVFYAEDFTGSDLGVQINNCINAAKAVKGTCDARKFTGTYTITHQIEVGDTSGTTVNLLLPAYARWSFNLNDATKCGIRQFDGTSLIGSGTGGGGGEMRLFAANGAVMDSIYCTDDSKDGYVIAANFSVENQGATLNTGSVNVRRLFDESRIQNIRGWNNYGDAFVVNGTCCGAVFDNVQGMSDTAGGHALHILKATSTTFIDSTFNKPGNGKSNIYIEGDYTGYLTFINTYAESNSAYDNVTPMVYIKNNVRTVTFIGGSVWCDGTTCNKFSFENHNTTQFQLIGVSVAKNAVKDDINNKQVTGLGITSALNYFSSTDSAVYNAPVSFTSKLYFNLTKKNAISSSADGYTDIDYDLGYQTNALRFWAGSGSTAQWVVYNNGDVTQKGKLDNNGNFTVNVTNGSMDFRANGNGGYAIGYGSGSGSVTYYGGGTSEVMSIDNAGNLRIPARKSTTGTRYACFDTAGKIVSQTTACSGT